MSASTLRTRILTAAGGSWPVTLWAEARCKASSTIVQRNAGALELRQGNRIVRLAPKHSFLAPSVCKNFATFAAALPAQLRNGIEITDFATQPQIFNACRTCLMHGASLSMHDGGVWVRKDTRAMILAPAHLVYVQDMAEKFDLYFSPLVPETRGDLQVLDYSTPGRLQTYKSGLQFEMASFPEEEEAIEEYFKWYRPQAGDTVFDIGAHCGVSTYRLSRLVGERGKVIAFEPDPINRGLLQRNIARHGLSNVEVVSAAIAGKAGTLQFNSEGTIGSSLQSLMQRDSVGSTVMVEAITLTDAFARWGVPAFCKIDIEGAEIEALTSAVATLRQSHTHFAIDTHHPKPNGQMTSHDVEVIFQRCGYQTLSEAQPLWTTWARPR